jgi:hypothetical protein
MLEGPQLHRLISRSCTWRLTECHRRARTPQRQSCICGGRETAGSDPSSWPTSSGWQWGWRRSRLRGVSGLPKSRRPLSSLTRIGGSCCSSNGTAIISSPSLRSGYFGPGLTPEIACFLPGLSAGGPGAGGRIPVPEFVHDRNCGCPLPHLGGPLGSRGDIAVADGRRRIRHHRGARNHRAVPGGTLRAVSRRLVFRSALSCVRYRGVDVRTSRSTGVTSPTEEWCRRRL